MNFFCLIFSSISSPINSLSHIFFYHSYIFYWGDIIYKDLVKKYISKLTVNNILEFSKKYNINISSKEADILFYFIKDNYNGLLEDDNTILKLKPLIRDDLFNEIYVIYKENKVKYF